MNFTLPDTLAAVNAALDARGLDSRDILGFEPEITVDDELGVHARLRFLLRNGGTMVVDAPELAGMLTFLTAAPTSADSLQ